MFLSFLSLIENVLLINLHLGGVTISLGGIVLGIIAFYVGRELFFRFVVIAERNGKLREYEQQAAIYDFFASADADAMLEDAMSREQGHILTLEESRGGFGVALSDGVNPDDDYQKDWDYVQVLLRDSEINFSDDG